MATSESSYPKWPQNSIGDDDPERNLGELPIQPEEDFRRLGKDALDDTYTLIMEWHRVLREGSRSWYAGTFGWDELQEEVGILSRQTLKATTSCLVGFWVGMGTPIPEATLTKSEPLTVRVQYDGPARSCVVEAFRYAPLTKAMHIESFPSREGGAALEAKLEALDDEIGVAVSIPDHQLIGTYTSLVRDVYGEVFAKFTIMLAV